MYVFMRVHEITCTFTDEEKSKFDFPVKNRNEIMIKINHF